MNSKVVEFAKRAGFCFWDREAHKPVGAIIDWSCKYDKELENFFELAVQYGKGLAQKDGEMKLTLRTENEDGSADFDLDTDAATLRWLINKGLVEALKEAIEREKLCTAQKPRYSNEDDML